MAAAAGPEVAPAPPQVRPEHVVRTYTPVVRWLLGATAAYYAFITVAHFTDTRGSTLAVLVALASLGWLLPTAFLVWLRRHPTPRLPTLELIAVVTYGLLFANVAVHQLLAFREERLVYFVFIAMVFGGTAPTARVAHGAIAVALAGMAICGLQMGHAFLDMYVFVGVAGGFTAVGVAAIMRQVVMREISARLLSESLLVEARSATQARSAFLAIVSHEIRTPLNAVLGMAQAMRLEPLSEQQSERLDVVKREATALSQLMDDILTVVSLEASGLELRSGPFDLQRLAAGLERLFSPPAREKGIALTLEVRDGFAGACVGDEGRLRQIAAALISNAIKFTPGGGEVRVLYAAGERDLTLTVEDTGVGIPARLQDRIFEPFALADDPMTRSAGGAGLGLAICRQLVAVMGGTIEVTSTVGAGTRFTVRTPISRVDATLAECPADAAHGGRVLVVDDNPTNRLVMRTLLEGLGLECGLAGCGREAVQACVQGHWDVVLMDIHMPQMDGMAATRAIRKRETIEGGAPTPIIAVTASVLPEDVARYEAAGMNGVVPKPVSLDVLAGALHRAFQVSAPRDEASPFSGGLAAQA